MKIDRGSKLYIV